MDKFSEIKYERPDFKKVKSDIRVQLSKFKNAGSYAEAKAAFLAVNGIYEKVATQIVVASIRNTLNTADKYYEAEMKENNKQAVMLSPLMKKVSIALVESEFAKNFKEDYGEQLFRETEAEIRTQNNKILLSMIRENELTQEYSKITAGCTVDFHGEKCNFYGLLKFMQDPDRSVRKAAFEEWSKLYEGIAPKLDEIYNKLVKLRVGQAKKLGFASYIDLAYLTRNRFDYTPKDVERFRAAVLKYIVPACAEIYEQKRERLELDKLHFYDEELNYKEGNAVPDGTPEELVAAAKKMYTALSPETGEFFDFMTKYEMFDLLTKPGKRLGGYCTALMGYKAPFIFSNFNGTSADVDVLTHEAGHAFEYYVASRELPLHQQHHSTSEINEIHSMTMEHFAYPYMDKFFGRSASKYRAAHLASSLCTIPYLVSVDEFQHKVFENPKMSVEERYATWKKIEQTYLPWRDYDGNEFLEKGGFWMQKQHIFMFPFYYIDYALAQICAFQFYGRMKENNDEAWASYLKLCRAGGSRGYFELLDYAGLKNPFDTLRAVRELGVKVGLTINPDVPVGSLYGLVGKVDMVLLMSVFAGYGGQKFIEETWTRIEELKEIIADENPDCLIQIDGGVNMDNAPKLFEAGVNVLVAGSAVFNSADPMMTIHEMLV